MTSMQKERQNSAGYPSSVNNSCPKVNEDWIQCQNVSQLTTVKLVLVLAVQPHLPSFFFSVDIGEGEKPIYFQ